VTRRRQRLGFESLMRQSHGVVERIGAAEELAGVAEVRGGDTADLSEGIAAEASPAFGERLALTEGTGGIRHALDVVAAPVGGVHHVQDFLRLPVVGSEEEFLPGHEDRQDHDAVFRSFDSFFNTSLGASLRDCAGKRIVEDGFSDDEGLHEAFVAAHAFIIPVGIEGGEGAGKAHGRNVILLLALTVVHGIDCLDKATVKDVENILDVLGHVDQHLPAKFLPEQPERGVFDAVFALTVTTFLVVVIGAAADIEDKDVFGCKGFVRHLVGAEKLYFRENFPEKYRGHEFVRVERTTMGDAVASFGGGGEGDVLHDVSFLPHVRSL